MNIDVSRGEEGSVAVVWIVRVSWVSLGDSIVDASTVKGTAVFL